MLEQSQRSGKVKIGQSPEERMKEARMLKEKQAAAEESRRQSSLYNQKFGILAGLFDVGAWKAAVDYNNMLKGIGTTSRCPCYCAVCAFSVGLSSAYAQLPVPLNPRGLRISQHSNDKHGA